jgi:hypothetical protein
LTHGAVNDVRFVLVRGTEVTLRFTGPLHARPLVFVRDAAGLPVWSGYAWSGDAPLTLTPGSYRAEVHGGGPLRTLDFSVADSPVVVKIDL